MADIKKTKPAVHYRPAEGDRKCGNCTMFRPPISCAAVKGPISPQMLCDLFARKK